MGMHLGETLAIQWVVTLIGLWLLFAIEEKIHEYREERRNNNKDEDED